VAILGADQLVTLNCIVPTTFALANGRGVWPAGQFPPYAADFFVSTWNGEKIKNFTIDHNLVPTWVSQKQRGMRPAEGFWHARR
jgi:hypothetical protein